MNRGQCKNCGLIEGHKGECKPDVPKVKGAMIYDSKVDSGLQILTPEQLAEVKRLRRSSGYGHND